MNSFKRLMSRAWVRKSIGFAAAEYLRLVRNTCSFSIDPPDFYERVAPELPVIATFWHGEHFMMPFVRRRHHVKALISRSRDGDINAFAAQRLGFKTIRASGSQAGDFHRKGGVAGFQAMRNALAQGWTVGLTADVPKVSRVAGRGVALLAQASGRPIYPMAVATSHCARLHNWDRSAINLPFGRFAIAVDDPIYVLGTADDAALEESRRQIEAGLNRATERAYAIVRGRAEDFDWGRIRQCSASTV